MAIMGKQGRGRRDGSDYIIHRARAPPQRSSFRVLSTTTSIPWSTGGHRLPLRPADTHWNGCAYLRSARVAVMAILGKARAEGGRTNQATTFFQRGARPPRPPFDTPLALIDRCIYVLKTQTRGSRYDGRRFTDGRARMTGRSWPARNRRSCSTWTTETTPETQDSPPTMGDGRSTTARMRQEGRTVLQSWPAHETAASKRSLRADSGSGLRALRVWKRGCSSSQGSAYVC
ncbi:hypothetical protein C8R47DRAFT_108608 [Mycena vitilis]|nr:hypothetical protein C8R47DRAFT_108608 [Mycena vitilis]